MRVLAQLAFRQTCGSFVYPSGRRHQARLCPTLWHHCVLRPLSTELSDETSDTKLPRVRLPTLQIYHVCNGMCLVRYIMITVGSQGVIVVLNRHLTYLVR